MQNTRGSSILGSLAVAFGDGLAFGAGVKLAQRGGPRHTSAPEPALEAAAPVDIAPLLERLTQIEARIGQVEQAPAPAQSAPAPFDQRVLEAIVTALDARLQEQAAQVERRLTELEAKLAIDLKSLRQQDHSVVTAVQTHIEELNAQFNRQLDAIRRSSEEERAAMREEIASLHREFAMEAAKAVEDRTAELRKEIASRDTQIAAMRAQLEVGDERLQNVVAAIAKACQTVVGRPGAQPKTAPERIAGPSPEPAPEPAPPNFGQSRPSARILPAVLVSSGALVSACLAMMHYL
jgi:hypothetical protein